jgi:hypothetical protein
MNDELGPWPHRDPFAAFVQFKSASGPKEVSRLLIPPDRIFSYSKPEMETRWLFR